jgi:hypothetical protein
MVVLVVLALSLSLLTAVAAAHEGTRHFVAQLDALNNSGVSGVAHLTLDGDTLTVTVMATGLEADKLHPQHIHGFANPSNSTCPTIAADANGDGLVSVGEGAPNYGPVLRALTPFTTAPGGTIVYEATFSGAELDGLQPLPTLQNRAIVIHGLSVAGAYDASLPVACGQIAPAPNGP